MIMRALLWLIVGVLLGGLVHLGTVLALPRFATRDAYSRLEPITPVNAVISLPATAPGSAVLPFMDPAFATAACRYDLSGGPIKFSAPVSQAYTSVSFYTRRGIAYYAINDRAAGRRVIELELMTSLQRANLPENEDITAADRLIVEAPTDTGLIIIRALAPELGAMTAARATLENARCQRE